ncbi:hypothetical protein C0995_001887, partial [Termitomyces sp. Mi166
QNLAIKKFNNNSILQTVIIKGISPLQNLDIELVLRAPYFYSNNTLAELVMSETLCNALSPLSPSLLCQVIPVHVREKREAEVVQQAEKKME